MSRRKTERLLSLVVCLLSAGRYLTAAQIREAVPGYPESFEAFKRMFERDKEELRELGIPLETGFNSPGDDEAGYRIPRQAYVLPEIRLEPDEAAVLSLAARVWRQAELAGAAAGALLKLREHGRHALVFFIRGRGVHGAHSQFKPFVLAQTRVLGAVRLQGREAFRLVGDAKLQNRHLHQIIFLFARFRRLAVFGEPGIEILGRVRGLHDPRSVKAGNLLLRGMVGAPFGGRRRRLGGFDKLSPGLVHFGVFVGFAACRLVLRPRARASEYDEPEQCEFADPGSASAENNSNCHSKMLSEY